MKDWFQGLVVDDGREERARLRGPCLLAWLFVVALFGAGIATCAQAQVNAEVVEIDCHDLAAFASFMTTYRDTGAVMDKVLALFRVRAVREDPAVSAVYEAELRRVWKDRLPREEAAQAAHKRCQDVLGEYPRKRGS